jgi:hypothetical protein
MLEDPDPLAVIKVTFDDIPDDFKNKLSIFFGTSLSCLVLLNIILCIYILENGYRKVRYLTNKNDNYYQRV